MHHINAFDCVTRHGGFAAPVDRFCRDYLNPYVNFHRPCLFAETITDAKDKPRKRCPDRLMMMPYEELKSLPEGATFLKLGVDFNLETAVGHGRVWGWRVGARRTQERPLLRRATPPHGPPVVQSGA